MKQLIILIAVIIIPSASLFSQYTCSEGIKYSAPVQTDSTSRAYVIGILPDKTNKDKYVFSSQPQQAYSGYTTYTISGLPVPIVWANIICYNADSKEAKKIFSENELVMIFPVIELYFGQWYSVFTGVTSLANQSYSIPNSNFMLLSIRTDEYNKDGIIDETDPVSLFICRKNGNNLMQLSPKNMNTTEWTLSSDKKTIIIKAEKDKNADKRFKNEDETIYQIDLNDDFTKIKTTAITIN